MLPAIADVTDPVLRAHYLQRLSRLARVSEDELRRELRRRPRQRTADRDGACEPGVVARHACATQGRLGRAGEPICFRCCYRVPALADQGRELDEDLFYISENRELFRRWRLSEPVSEEESELWELYQLVMTG